MPKDDNKPELAGLQYRFEPRAPRLRMNKSYRITWHFDLLVGTNQDGHAMSQHFYEDVVKQCTGSAPPTVKEPRSMRRY